MRTIDSPPSAITVAAVAVVAYALCDMIHEVLGHGAATLLTPGVTAASLTTVALSTYGSSRFVAAAGTLANLAAGGALFVLGIRRKSATLGYFVWLLATINLFNGTAYLLYSGLLGSGDWTAVTAGLQPAAAWRGLLVMSGVFLYALAVRVSGMKLASLVDRGSVRESEVRLLTTLPYWVGGALLVAGAIPNPVSAMLILTSAAATGFGAMAGLLLVGRFVRQAPADAISDDGARIVFSAGWVMTGVLVTVVFVGIIGPGIHLRG